MISDSYKKGVVNDLATIIIFGVLMAFSLVIIYGVVSSINTAFSDAGTSFEAGQIRFSRFSNQFVQVWDVGFLVLLIGIMLAGVIGLFILNSHPVLALASWIGGGVLALVAAALANAYSDFALSSGVSDWVNSFTFIPLVMGNFFEFILVMLGIFLIALYAKIGVK